MSRLTEKAGDDAFDKLAAYIEELLDESDDVAEDIVEIVNGALYSAVKSVNGDTKEVAKIRDEIVKQLKKYK